ncbi:NrsF family protein [Phenylobacterium sp.]|uniref:NrsF family protein n=1 Tax=Phenylobacterium sp. TaxID=1871053 RepID=UPI00356321B0
MKTDELIQNLSGDLAPVAPGAAARRVALGLGGGAVVATAVMLAWLGLRPDLAQAVTTTMFWMKFGYAVATGLILAAVLIRLAKPAVPAGALAAFAGAPLAVVIVMALVRFANAPPETHRALLMGHSSSLCPWRILVIGLPLLVGAVWAVRGLAPTRLLLAGLAAGGAAGGLGAAIYAFACNETSAPFLAIWYTLGMALVAALGALGGSRLLRWR